jgi:hypothetical protein
VAKTVMCTHQIVDSLSHGKVRHYSAAGFKIFFPTKHSGARAYSRVLEHAPCQTTAVQYSDAAILLICGRLRRSSRPRALTR